MRSSLKRRLLTFLIGPLLAVLIGEAFLIYSVALNYSNNLHDLNLVDSARSLALLMANRSGDDYLLSADARFLMENDPEGSTFYEVSSARRGVIVANARLVGPPQSRTTQQPLLFDTRLENRRLRAVSVSTPVPDGDTLLITVAETLNDRSARAREILFIAAVIQSITIVTVLSLVWLGVSRGLQRITPLTERLGAQGNDLQLSPITDADVPIELLPLTRTIDGLFRRLRSAQALQTRFIADAAHQLRTPLAGLRLHVERALADPRPEVVQDALSHIDTLSQRGARTANQLLALLRAQAPTPRESSLQAFDLTRLVTSAVSARVIEALNAGSDLGYEGEEAPCIVLGDADLLHDLLDNLIDNALRYAGPGRRITTALCPTKDGVLLSVEDNGPGVAETHLQHLGERFFRVPGSTAPGTGLGLAIARQIALVHGTELRFLRGAGGVGLRVELALKSGAERELKPSPPDNRAGA